MGRRTHLYQENKNWMYQPLKNVLRVASVLARIRIWRYLTVRIQHPANSKSVSRFPSEHSRKSSSPSRIKSCKYAAIEIYTYTLEKPKKLKSLLLQSQTKIVGTLRPNAVCFLLVLPLSLSKLFIAVRSPNLVHQHWGDKETRKCPNNFDWDCRLFSCQKKLTFKRWKQRLLRGIYLTVKLGKPWTPEIFLEYVIALHKKADQA